MATPVDNMLARLEHAKVSKVRRKITVPYPEAMMARVDRARARLSEQLGPIGQSDLVIACLDEGLAALERRLGLHVSGERIPARVAGDAEAAKRPYKRRATPEIPAADPVEAADRPDRAVG